MTTLTQGVKGLGTIALCLICYDLCSSFQRWQRRFFILYDDGELTYSVDDNVSSVYIYFQYILRQCYALKRMSSLTV